MLIGYNGFLTLHCNFICLGAARRLGLTKKELLWPGSSLDTQNEVNSLPGKTHKQNLHENRI